MRAASAPTPPPPPPPVRADPCAVEPDEQWKAEVRKRIEDGLRIKVEEAQTVRGTILNSHPSESSRELALSNYEKNMNDIRTLAQAEFTRQLRIEMSERKWALDVVDSNSPDVALQQQWILDSIHKTDEDHTATVPSGAPHNHPKQGDSEHGFDESPDDGYRSAGLGGEGGESGESRETSEEGDEDEEEGEDWGEENVAPRQLRPPSRPNVPLTQPLHSKSPVSRRHAPSHQRSNFHPTEDNDDEDAYDSHGHSVQRHPYPPDGAPRRQSSGSQSSPWRPVPRAPEPSGISRTFAHANGQIYNTGNVQFPRRGSVNSTGSTSSGAGLHHAGSLNSEQYRGSNVAPHGGAEHPPTQNRDRIASNIVPRERQTSASTSPHKRPSLSSYPTVSPRAIPGSRPPPLDDAVRFPTSPSSGSRTMYSLQRSPEDMKPGIAIPRRPTTPEDDPRATSWSSLNPRRSFGDFNLHRRHNSKGDQLPPVDGDLSDASDDVVGQLDVRQSTHSVLDIRSVRSLRSVDLEQRALWIEAEAKRRDEEASKKEDEVRRLEEKARQSLEVAKRLEAGAKNKETEAKRKEAEVKKREVESQKREAKAQRKEEQVRQMEREVRRKEEQARRKEEEAERKEDEVRKREEEVRRKEEGACKREDDANARRSYEDAQQREILAQQKEVHALFLTLTNSY